MSAWTVPSYAEGWTVPGYVEERQLGTGASGRVVAAVSELTGQRVAIKYLSPALVRDPSFMWGFRTEAQTLRALDVPQVVQLYAYVEEPGQGAAIVMELVDGVSLHEMISQRGPTTPESALVVLKGSLLGLAAAHALGIVHRDYKPENVLVDTQGDSKLSDFGVATKAGKKALAAGTPLYMAPEQWNGAPNSPATDVYAATAVFFECLTAETPFTGKLGQLREQHETAAVPTDRIYPPLQGLIARGMAKNPLDRPQSAIAFVAELEATAAAVYGPEWEERGRSQLAERAAALLPLLLLRHGQPGAGGTSGASTWLGAGGGSGGRGRRRGARRRRVLTVAAIAAVAVVAVGAVATAVTIKERSHPPTLSEAATITPTFSAEATVTPPVTASKCTTAASFSYKGTITATAAGTVSYQWVYSSGKPGPVQTAQFAAAGHRQVTGEVVKSSKAGTGWGEIKLVKGKVSNKASYKLLCGTSAGGISATASVNPPTAHNTCATTTPTFTATGSISSEKKETVTYYWALSDGQNSSPAKLTFTSPGTMAAAPLTITPPGDPASGEAVLVVTSPVSAASAPATYTLTCTAAPQTVTAAATASPASATVASCTAAAPTITFAGNITATAAGAVGYYWKLPGGNGPAQTLNFTGAGTMAVTAASYKPASDTASGSGSIVVTSPHATSSNAAAFKLACGAGLSLTSSAASTATVGAAYSGTATVTGGQGAYTWSVTGLPAGLTSAPSAGTLKISGTPNTAGTATVTLKVTDSAAPKHTATTSFTLTVGAAKLTLTANAATTATTGAAYSATVTAAGGTPAYKYSATGLPAGLAVSATTGAVSGTPTAAGTSTITVTVTDTEAKAQTATASWTLTVSAPKLTLTANAAATATTGAAYSATVTAAGGTPAYKYSATGLPAGLAVSATTGAVSGKPTAAGTSTITVTVTDTEAKAQTATASWTLTVSAAKPVLAGGALTAGRVGVAYSATVAASGGTPGYTYSAASLPSGLTMSTSGTISGTPKVAAGTFSFTVTVTDAAKQTASATYSITFAAAVSASPSPSPSQTLPVIT
ncbi:MAG TPA: putative Ig domain-containing protein [Trebonia sp.]|nr:putative Ig domain-containing protein [Trebonia sp.]